MAETTHNPYDRFDQQFPVAMYRAARQLLPDFGDPHKATVVSRELQIGATVDGIVTHTLHASCDYRHGRSQRVYRLHERYDLPFTSDVKQGTHPKISGVMPGVLHGVQRAIALDEDPRILIDRSLTYDTAQKEMAHTHLLSVQDRANKNAMLYEDDLYAEIGSFPYWEQLRSGPEKQAMQRDFLGVVLASEVAWVNRSLNTLGFLGIRIVLLRQGIYN